MKKIIKKKTVKLGVWTAGWVLSYALFSMGPGELWDSISITIIALTINVIVATGMLVTNKNLFKSYDELQKQIQLEAIAITLGISVIFGCVFE